MYHNFSHDITICSMIVVIPTFDNLYHPLVITGDVFISSGYFILILKNAPLWIGSGNNHNNSKFPYHKFVVG